MTKRKPKTTKYDTSPLEETFLKAWKETNLPITPQKLFHPRRMWRFDFAFDDIFLAIEIQGYGAGHASYMGLSSDYEKHNAAIELGWVVLYFMKHDLVKTRLEQTISFVVSLHSFLSNNPSMIQARRQINQQTRQSISHAPSPQHDKFLEWIRKNK